MNKNKINYKYKRTKTNTNIIINPNQIKKMKIQCYGLELKMLRKNV